MPRMQSYFADKEDARQSVKERKEKGLEFIIAKVMEKYSDGSDKLEKPYYYIGLEKNVVKLEARKNFEVKRLKSL